MAERALRAAGEGVRERTERSEEEGEDMLALELVLDAGEMVICGRLVEEEEG